MLAAACGLTSTPSEHDHNPRHVSAVGLPSTYTSSIPQDLIAVALYTRTLHHLASRCAQGLLERAFELVPRQRVRGHAHRKAHHRHDISFLMGRAGAAALELHLLSQAGVDPAAEEPDILKVRSSAAIPGAESQSAGPGACFSQC